MREGRSEHEDMTDLEKQRLTDDEPAPYGEEGQANLRRRHLLKVGLGAGPVIMTLTSRPVFGGGAGGGGCQCPSNFVSGNVSHPGGQQSCTGKKPSYWCQSVQYCKWPSPCQPKQTGTSGYTCGAPSVKATPFHCTTTGFAGTYFGSYTMLDVMTPSAGVNDPQQVGGHIAAALLNAKAGLTPVLTESAVRDIWNEYIAKGYYEPTAGVKWYSADIVTYLQSTMA
jgi:hypothetical protein